MKRVEALKLLGEGWELGVARHGGEASVSIQKGGLGRGGEVRTVSWTVYEAMLKRKEIKVKVEPEEKRKYWLTRYELSAANSTEGKK